MSLCVYTCSYVCVWVACTYVHMYVDNRGHCWVVSYMAFHLFFIMSVYACVCAQVYVCTCAHMFHNIRVVIRFGNQVLLLTDPSAGSLSDLLWGAGVPH